MKAAAYPFQRGRYAQLLPQTYPAAVFFASLRTDLGSISERTVTNLGAQLDLEVTLAHRLPMTFSVGYAIGYENSDRKRDEWMISLKIL